MLQHSHRGQDRKRRQDVVLVVGLILTLSGIAAAASSSFAQTVASALTDITPQSRLRVTLSGGALFQGLFAGLHGDTLVLAGEGQPREQWDLDQDSITRIEVWDSGTVRGAKWGAATGAVVVGALGGLSGWALSSISEYDDTGTVQPILAGAALGALSGALVVGGIGAGVGSLSSGWVVLYPAGEAPPRGDRDSFTHTTHLFLDVSEAWNADRDAPDGVFGARLGLLRDMGSHVQMGPAIGFYNFEQQGYLLGCPAPCTAVTGTDPVTNMGLDVLFSARSRGFAPYAALGAGWYVSSDLYAGVMGGGGLRWRTAGGQDYHLDVRRHASISGDISGGVDDFWTLSAGITFGNP